MAKVLAEETVETDLLQSALALMKDAMVFLDECGAPADIGAHLDLAIVRLEHHRANSFPE